MMNQGTGGPALNHSETREPGSLRGDSRTSTTRRCFWWFLGTPLSAGILARAFVRVHGKGFTEEIHGVDPQGPIIFLILIGGLTSGVCFALRKPDKDLPSYPRLMGEALLVAFVCWMISIFVMGFSIVWV